MTDAIIPTIPPPRTPHNTTVQQQSHKKPSPKKKTFPATDLKPGEVPNTKHKVTRRKIRKQLPQTYNQK